MNDRVGIERTPDGRRLAVSRRIDAPADRTWDLLVDPDRWPEWGPSVTDVEASDRPIVEGTTGRVRTVGGIRLPFEVTTCREYRWTWRVAGIPATGHRIEPLGDACSVVFEVPLPAAAYAPVCRRALRAIERLAKDCRDRVPPGVGDVRG